MRSYFGTAISDNIGHTPEGYLICRNVVVSRTATKKPILYTEDEMFGGVQHASNQMQKVWRRPETVFDEASMASLEGKPVCSPHPVRFLQPENYMAYAKGVCLNVHRGPVLDGEETLMADLIITDPVLIDSIRSGQLRECSIGYDCKYIEVNGEWEQRDIRANHLAVIPRGRVGHAARIYDNDPQQEEAMTLEQAMAELRRITNMIEQQRATTDAQVEDADNGHAAREYAQLVNELGAKMGRRQCRELLPRDTTRWPSLMTLDSDSIAAGANEAQAASVGYDDAKDYATAMRECHRK